MSKYRVALYGAYPGFLREIKLMFPADDPIEDDELLFVDPPTPQNHTHVIAFTNAKIDERLSGHVPRRNRIGIALEPRIFMDIGPTSVKRILSTLKTFICSEKHMRITNSVAGYCLIPAMSFQYVPSVPTPLAQRFPVSLPLSDKKIAPLHEYRHTLAAALLSDKRTIPVHIWGLGAAEHKRRFTHDDRIFDGQFVGYEPYENYAFCVAIENRVEGMYFSEKVTLPIYFGCTPLYIGSPFIDRFLPSATIPLTGDCSKDVEIVARAAAGHLPPCDTDAAKKYFQKNWHWGRAVKNFFSGRADSFGEKVPHLSTK